MAEDGFVNERTWLKFTAQPSRLVPDLKCLLSSQAEREFTLPASKGAFSRVEIKLIEFAFDKVHKQD